MKVLGIAAYLCDSSAALDQLRDIARGNSRPIRMMSGYARNDQHPA
jgi:hypothetical protein